MDVGHKRGNRNAKWSEHGAEALPAWVAEHDFRPPPAVLDAMRATIDRGDFGYHDLEADVGAAFAQWARQRYGWSPDPDFVHTCVDVLQGVTTRRSPRWPSPARASSSRRRSTTSSCRSAPRPGAASSSG